MKRVALLSYHSCPIARLGEPTVGGMNVYVRHVAEELARAGVEVDVFSRRHNSEEPAILELAPGVRLIHIEAGPPQTPKEDLYQHLSSFYCDLQALVEEEGRQYDLVHSHYWLSAWVGEVLAQSWGVPHVATFHTLVEIKRLVQAQVSDPPQRGVVERRIASTADAMVVSDRHEQEALVGLYGADPQRIHVIPLGVEPVLFQPVNPEEARRALGLDGRRMALFVGRLDAIKGLDVLLHMVAGMEEWQDLLVLIVGGDPEQEAEGLRLKELAAELGLVNRVRFEGTVPQERLPLYYSAAEALVMPSYYESFGLVALEAMACGTPVVAARVGGLASLVKDWDTGCLVAGHCPDSFAQRLETLLSHSDLRDSMGQAARLYAHQFSWETVAHRTLALYQELQRDRSVVLASAES